MRVVGDAFVSTTPESIIRRVNKLLTASFRGCGVEGWRWRRRATFPQDVYENLCVIVFDVGLFSLFRVVTNSKITFVRANVVFEIFMRHLACLFCSIKREELFKLKNVFMWCEFSYKNFGTILIENFWISWCIELNIRNFKVFFLFLL